MVIKRCQVCDGPVENGRCKLCGMPYRNDELRYHLNEDRSEHYRHASEEERRAMREEEIPLPDRTKPAAAAQGQKHTVAAQGQKHTAAAQGQKYAAAAQGQKPAAPVKNERHGGYGNSTEQTSRRRNTGVFVLILVIVVFLVGVVPGAVDYVQTIRVDHAAASLNVQELERYGTLGKDYGDITVGEGIPAGTYLAVIHDGYATVRIESGGDVTRVSLGEKNRQAELELEDGEKVSVHSTDSPRRTVELYRAE